MDKYMKIAIEEAKISEQNGDIPVGAVIVRDNKVISQSHNKKETSSCATKHAEIIVIEEACKKLNTWHLDECTLYTTMEPCMMCCGAIFQSRIKNVIYGVKNEKFGFSKFLIDRYKINCKEIEENEEISNMLKKFFKERR